MELGERLRQARLEAGLSQRQLCGDAITRNMLSQIENGSARPSMQTLSYLAGRLGKSVSFFLEEQAVTSPNQQIMDAAKQAFDQNAPAQVLALLEGYRQPDPVFDREMHLLTALSSMALAEQALKDGKNTYCVSLLDQAKAAGEKTPYCTEALERQRLLLLAQAMPRECAHVCQALPSLLPELLIRARAAQDPRQQAQILDAAAPCDDPQWNLLRGECCVRLCEYSRAAEYLKQAEAHFPERAYSLLEQCYRELEDYKMAYYYACLTRQYSP